MGLWVRLTGIALLLYIPWIFYRDFGYPHFEHGADAVLGFIFWFPIIVPVSVPILLIAYRLLRVSPVDHYRRVAAVCGIVFMIADILHVHQVDRQAQIVTFPIVLVAFFSALLAATLPSKKTVTPATSPLPQSKELRR